MLMLQPEKFDWAKYLTTGEKFQVKVCHESREVSCLKEGLWENGVLGGVGEKPRGRRGSQKKVFKLLNTKQRRNLDEF